jgi:hypothetical protein
MDLFLFIWNSNLARHPILYLATHVIIHPPMTYHEGIGHREFHVKESVVCQSEMGV